MSRKYPIEVEPCPVCNGRLYENQEGETRPHSCWVGHDGTPTPWEFYGLPTAARLLGVEPLWLTGVGAKAGRLRMHKVVRIADVGKPDAESRYRYNREDVDALAAMLKEGE